MNYEELERSVTLLTDEGKLGEASALLLEADKERPGDSEILLMRGMVEEASGNYHGARSLLENAVAAGSLNPLCYLRLGKIYSRTKDFDIAVKCYREAVAIQPDLVEARILLASMLKFLRKFEPAIQHLVRAMQLQPDTHGYAELAQMYEHVNRLDEAEAAAKRSLDLDTDNVAAKMALGNIYKRAGDYVQAEVLFRDAAFGSSSKRESGSASIFLGQVLDRQGRYKEAFDSFETGKAVWSVLADEMRLDRQEMPGRVARKLAYSRSATYADADDPSKRSFSGSDLTFFVGFPRSGTTLVERVLGLNSRVVSSHEKPILEPVIRECSSQMAVHKDYPECLDDMDDENIRMFRESYWRKARLAAGFLSPDSMFVDKLPLNIVNLEFPAKVFPNSRILVALRDPRDVCLSCYMQAFALNHSMVQFLSLESTARFYSEVMGLWLSYRSVLPLDWYEYRYEDLVDDFDGETRRIFSFLELEYPNGVSGFYKTTRNILLSTPSYQDVSKPIYTHSKERWRNYEQQLSPFMHYLEPFIREFGYSM